MLNKIKIAVSINEFGQWAAYGRWDLRDNAVMEEANGAVSHDGPHACYIVELEVPVPTTQQFDGKMNLIEIKPLEEK